MALENPGNDPKEANPVAISVHVGVGLTGIGVIDSDGRLGGRRSEAVTPMSDSSRG